MKYSLYYVYMQHYSLRRRYPLGHLKKKKKKVNIQCKQTVHDQKKHGFHPETAPRLVMGLYLVVQLSPIDYNRAKLHCQ